MGMKTYLDWSAYDTYGVGDAYAGIPATGGNYAKAVAVCMNNHQCQRDGKGDVPELPDHPRPDAFHRRAGQGLQGGAQRRAG
jgi:hypothetical protein